MGKIAPHCGKELELLLKGNKPMAMVSLSEGKSFQPYVKSGELIHYQTKVGQIPRAMRDVYVLPGEEWRVFQLQAAYDKVAIAGVMTDADHQVVGRLLGYSEEDINCFISN